MTSAENLTGCAVCQQAEPDPRLLQSCFECGNPFHLNPRTDVPGIDCGDAWIGESLGVEYYCQTCIDLMQAHSMEPQPDPTLSRYAAVVQAMTPGAPGPAVVPRDSRMRATELPPKPERPRVRRRYRRINS